MARIISFTDARARLTELVDDVEARHEHVVITRNGRPAAVVVPAPEWQAIGETLDVLRDGFIGAGIGCLAGLLGAGLLMAFRPFGDVPHYVYFIIVGVATMFGAWEGGLTGIATEHKNLKKFHRDIEAGKFLILVYTRKEQGAAIRHLMRDKHPEAELVAVNKHFINPFKPVRRRHRPARGPEAALQKD